MMQLYPHLTFKGQCEEAFKFYEECLGLQLNLADAAAADRIFNALAENRAAVQMPIQETFWALRFGGLVDRFGTPWMINCEKGAREAN